MQLWIWNIKMHKAKPTMGENRYSEYTHTDTLTATISWCQQYTVNNALSKPPVKAIFFKSGPWGENQG